MSVEKPFFRTARVFSDNHYSEGGRWQYVEDDRYAANASAYIRAFLILQRDLIDLFEYVEPADQNLRTFSYRIHEMLVRTCIEIEANFKAILNANKYSKSAKTNIWDYKKVDHSHFLSHYEVRYPYWRGDTAILTPFAAWRWGDEPLSWYQNYNLSKHNRQEGFSRATFQDLMNAMGGLVILLSSQFLSRDFSPGPDHLALEGGPADSFEYAIGGYFGVRFPSDIPDHKKYNFDWNELAGSEEPFQKFDYDNC